MEEMLRKLKERFGIQGEVQWLVGEPGDFPTVYSWQEGQYFIVLPREESFPEFKIDLYHEFGHIALAERVHPTFVGFGISAPRWWKSRFEAMLQGAADVLVNGLLWEIESKIALKEIFSSLELVAKIAKSSEEIGGSLSRAEGAFLVIHTLLTEAYVERAPLTPEIQAAKELMTESSSYLFPKFPEWFFPYREALIELPRKDFTIRKYLAVLRAFWREAFKYNVSLRNRTFYFKKI